MFSSPGSPTPSVELDWRFAALIADAWGDPELARRYAADPVALLAEYGMAVESQDAPALPAGSDVDLVIEDFSGADHDFPHVPLCMICSMDDAALPAAATA